MLLDNPWMIEEIQKGRVTKEECLNWGIMSNEKKK